MEEKQRIVIVGGVAAGMSAAARARRLSEDAEIIVLEQGPYVSFANCGLPYFVGKEIAAVDDLLLQTPASLSASLNLDVRINHEVIAIDPKAQTVTVRTPSGTEVLTYSQLVLTPGGKAFIPDTPGIDLPHVHTLRTVDDARHIRHQMETQSGDTQAAAVLGAGFIGIEAAEALARQGWKVTLVELSNHVLPPLDQEMASLVDAELKRLGITVRTGAYAKEIFPDRIELDDGTLVRASLVIASIGVRPDTDLFADAGLECERGAIVVDEHGRTNLPNVWAGGDAISQQVYLPGPSPYPCRPVALAGPANRAGRLIADDIVGLAPARPLPAALGTAIVRVGELTCATTGANRATLVANDIPFHTIHLHPNQHAGYFPGATPIHLVIHFGTDGTLLGAQAIGRAGVDKRIDVLATAMRGGLLVTDLIDLDLAYSPPYGMAKDPINLAGMVAENVLEGTLRLWYPAEVDQARQDGCLIDVRSEAEFARGHIDGALNIPHLEIRGRLDEIATLAKGGPVYLSCQSGMRSYLAQRVLSQAGLDAYSLSGGWLTYTTWFGGDENECH